VVDGDEVLVTNQDAHLQTEIFLEVDAPGTGMADDFTITRLDEQRALPESLRQRFKAKRLEEIFAVVNHAELVDLLFLQDLGQVVALGGSGWSEQREDVSPCLCPGVAEEIGADESVLGNGIRAIFLGELSTSVSVQGFVKGSNLVPDALDFRGKLVGRQVVIGAPHGAHVFVSKLARALVLQRNELGVAVAHGYAACIFGHPDFMPCGPDLLHLLGIAAAGENLLNFADGEALAGLLAFFDASLALPVRALKTGAELCNRRTIVGIGQ